MRLVWYGAVSCNVAGYVIVLCRVVVYWGINGHFFVCILGM